jgi:hypothetical protein
VECAGEGQRRGARAAAGLGAARGSCQSRRWHRQSGNGGERLRPAAAEGQLGRVAEQRGVLGESQQEGVEAAGERGGDAWRLGEAGGGLERRGTAASGGAAARQRRQRKNKGGALGADLQFQKLQGPHYNAKFPTILKLK